MERGLFIGGVLVCGSIALALMLNIASHQRTSVPPPVSCVPLRDDAVDAASREPDAAPAEGCVASFPQGRGVMEKQSAPPEETPGC